MAGPARRLPEKPLPYWLAEKPPARLSLRTPEQDAEAQQRVDDLLGKIKDRTAIVVVVGLG